jgi:hypothetical protein
LVLSRFLEPGTLVAQVPLGLLQARSAAFSELRALNQLTIAGRDQEVDAQVDPDAPSRLRERLGRDIDAVHAQPVALAFPADGDGLRGPF